MDFQSKDSPTLGSGFPVYLFRRGGSELQFWAVPGEAKYNPDPETSGRDGSRWQSG